MLSNKMQRSIYFVGKDHIVFNVKGKRRMRNEWKANASDKAKPKNKKMFVRYASAEMS